MPGTILSATTRKRIADCHIKSAHLSTNRDQLTTIYQAAQLSLVKGELFDTVVNALEKRAKELGVYKERNKKNA